MEVRSRVPNESLQNRRTLRDRMCLICNIKLESVSELNKNFGNTVFILRNILELSSEQADSFTKTEEGYLEENGYICDRCNEKVKDVKKLFEQLQKITKEYEKVKLNLRREIKDTDSREADCSWPWADNLYECRRILWFRTRQSKPRRTISESQTSLKPNETNERNYDELLDNLPVKVEVIEEEEEVPDTDVEPTIPIEFGIDTNTPFEKVDPLTEVTEQSIDNLGDNCEANSSHQNSCTDLDETFGGISDFYENVVSAAETSTTQGHHGKGEMGRKRKSQFQMASGPLTFIDAYTCGLCFKKFKTTASKSVHQRRHFPGQYKCLDCSKIFVRKYEVVRHMRLVHQQLISSDDVKSLNQQQASSGQTSQI